MITKTSLKHLKVKLNIREACKVAFYHAKKYNGSKIPTAVKNRNGETYLFVRFCIEENRFIVTCKKSKVEVTNKIYKEA